MHFIIGQKKALPLILNDALRETTLRKQQVVLHRYGDA